MLDINFIKDNQDLIEQTIKNKNIKLDLGKLMDLDIQRRVWLNKLEQIKAQKNAASKDIASMQDPEQKQKAISQMQESAKQERSYELELKKIMVEFDRLMLLVPQITHPDTPIGASERQNVEIRKWGKTPEFKFKSLDHVQLGEKLDILDFKRAVKIGGSRTYMMKGDGARLEHALLQAAIDHITAKKFTLMNVPTLVEQKFLVGTGFFPGAEQEIYHLTKDNKYLVGTSEVSLMGYHSDEMIKEEDLPINLAGYSTCYRREAGSYGKDTKGLYRVHQFNKVEQVILCKNDKAESMKMHAIMMKITEEFLQKLGLPYRVLNICTGDMGQGKYYMNDIECWMPSRKSYGETHSCSALLDFQTRRLNIRYKQKSKTLFCHSLNNTVIATPRILIPIIENNQTKEGKIKIPELLQHYMNNQKVIG